MTLNFLVVKIQNMKGIIFAGGQGTRLRPLTKIINKHLLPVGKEPMLYNPIRKMIEAGIHDILIITNKKDIDDIKNLLKNEGEFEANFIYQIQEESIGTANALSLGEKFADNQKILIIYGDNITTASLANHTKEFINQKKGALLLLKEVKDPERFGVATVKNDTITEIEEKPKNPKSNLAITGYLMYNPDVFDIAKSLKLSVRGEYEMTDIYQEYMKNGELKYKILDKEWVDAGTFESLAEATQILLKEENAS